MVSKLVLKDIKSYLGVNVISLDEAARISAFIGKSGAGKSTIFTALAFGTATIDIGGISESAYVEIEHAGYTFRRTGSQTYFVNGEASTRTAYRELVAQTLRLTLINSNRDWRYVLSSPEALLQYVYNISLYERGNELDAMNYVEAVAEEKRCAEEMRRVTNNLQKLKREHSLFSEAQDFNTGVLYARRLNLESKVKLDALRAELSKRKIQAADTIIGKLDTELASMRRVASQDREVLGGITSDLNKLQERYRTASTDKKFNEVALKGELDTREKLHIHISNAESTKDMASIHDGYISRVRAIFEDRRWVLGPSKLDDMLPDGPHYNERALKDRRFILSDQKDMLQSLKIETKQVLGHIDVRIRAVLSKLEKFLSLLNSSRRIICSHDAQLYELISEVSEKKSALKELTMDPKQRLGENLTMDSPAIEETISSLKLMYPRILGSVLEFVRPKGNSEISSKTAMDIMMRVSRFNEELVLVVEDEATSLEYAKEISSFHSWRLVFLPRRMRTGKSRSIAQILDSFAGVIPLASLFEVVEGHGEHLVLYATQEVLLMPNQESVARLLQEAPGSYMLCDYSGNLWGSTTSHGFQEIGAEKALASSETYRSHLEAAVEGLESDIKDAVHAKQYWQNKELVVTGLLNQSRALIENLEQSKNKLQTFLDNCCTAFICVDEQLQYLPTSPRGEGASPHPRRIGKAHNLALQSLTGECEANQRHLKKSFNDWPPFSNGLNDAEAPDYDLESWKKRIGVLDRKIEYLRAAIADNDRLSAKIKADMDSYEEYLERNRDRPEQLDRSCDEINNEIKQLQLVRIKNELQIHEAESQLHASETLIGTDVFNQALAVAHALAGSADENELEQHIRELESDDLGRSKLVETIVSNPKADTYASWTLEKVRAAESEIREIQTRYDAAADRLRELDSVRHELIRETITRISPYFHDVYQRFYSHIGNTAPQTYLKLVDESDISKGLSFHVIPAGKPFCATSNLSSGEFTVALAAFQGAIHLAFRHNLLLIDEVDAYLDSMTVGRLAQLLQELSSREDEPSTVFVATHQRRLYNIATQFIGLFKEGAGTSVFVAT